MFLLVWGLGLLMFVALLYRKAARQVWAVAWALILTLATMLHGGFGPSIIVLLWLPATVHILLMYSKKLRIIFFIKPFFKTAQRMLPGLSDTEKVAIESGGVGWEAELALGEVNFSKLYNLPAVSLTKEEQDFLDGPVNDLCRMVDVWDLQHHQFTLPKDLIDFLKKNRFFSLLIPKKYGGLEFSALAHSEMIAKVAGVNAALASLVSVPNSLGPAELLLQYGTAAQQEYYLPRLAAGDDIPCFALTSPYAGSDASAMIDYGVVCRCKIAGKDGLGIRLQWHKRYITLAPIATLLGLAFKLYDPEHLIGEKQDLGITCALIPVDTPGVEMGRRHNPLGAVFPNGPTKGKDVLISLDQIIGGVKMAGEGWRMLMECLAAGRSISLPGVVTGMAKKVAVVTGAYARTRRQFNSNISAFGGVAAALADLVGHTHMMEAMRHFAMSRLDQGERSAVSSAMCKYHATEWGRRVINHAMDIHGGKGICLGPKNYLAEFYTAMPISITVEGANILTRSLIIYGQGVMRCHPYLYKEVKLLQQKNQAQALQDFDTIISKHIAWTLSNVIACFWHGITGARCAHIGIAVEPVWLKRNLQMMQRYAAVFATLTEVLLLTYGARLKRNEQMTARMGDLHSYLYIMTSLLHYHHNKPEVEGSDDLLRWGMQHLLFLMQQTVADIIEQLPKAWLRILLRAWIFPAGKCLHPVPDSISKKLVDIVQAPSDAADRLAEGCYIEPSKYHEAGRILAALPQIIAVEPLLNKIRHAVNNQEITGLSIFDQIKAALNANIITEAEGRQLQEAEQLRQKLIAVDDFDFANFVPSYKPSPNE